jgi:hypothetical protein
VSLFAQTSLATMNPSSLFPLVVQVIWSKISWNI